MMNFGFKNASGTFRQGAAPFVGQELVGPLALDKHTYSNLLNTITFKHYARAF